MSSTWVKSSIPDSVRQRLRPVRRFLGRSRPGYVLSRMPVTGEMIARAPAAPAPILVSSLPRAGSSWVGRILGGAENALYLREPLTQSYLRQVGPGHPPFFEWDMCHDRAAYDRFATLAFRGIPRFSGSIVPFPRQWAISRRGQKHLVVKEVNPLVLERLWARFQPRIVLLVRHPVSVARSFHALGWTSDQFATRFMPETLAAFGRERPLPAADNYWEQAGAFQAIAQNVIVNSLEGIDYLVARYEDLCAHPLAEFARIFEFAGMGYSSAVRREVERSSQSDANYAPGAYDTVRNSSEMRHRWKQEVSPADVESVRRGYFACRPVFYRDDADW